MSRWAATVALEIRRYLGQRRIGAMAIAARDRLARTLRGDAQTAFSVELTARPDDLLLAVEGYGLVKFPVTPARARRLLGLGQPARFGRGEETLTDPDVRDTWEIPRQLVRAEWDAAALTDVLWGGTWELFGPALRAADAVAEPQTAAMLLRPFRIEDLDRESVDSFGKIAGTYGQPWTAELLRTWFGGDRPAWAYGGEQERPRWVADRLPGLCARLHASGRAGPVGAQRLLDLAWEWLARDIGTGFASSSPSRRDERLSDLGRPLASVLAAAAAIGAAGTRDLVTGHIREQPDAVTALELSALRAAAGVSGTGARGDAGAGDPRRDAGVGDLAADCAARLRARLARPRRASADWSIELPAGGCACELCRTLRTFLDDKCRRTFEWPLAKERRQHVHSRIDAAELPVTHVTRRQGRPYTLVLNKTDELLAREQQARTRDETDLEWLARVESRRLTGATPNARGDSSRASARGNAWVPPGWPGSASDRPCSS
jgi:hypothetical protein